MTRRGRAGRCPAGLRRVGLRRAGLRGAAGLVLVLFAAAAVAPAAAQAPPTVEAAVTGTVVNGTAGGAGPAGARVQLISLDGDGEIRTREETVGADGRYRFALPADPELTHLVRVVFAGVQYIGQPVLVSAELPAATQDFTVYDTTTEAPPLSITRTVATVVLIERQAGEIAFVREDLVRNDGDRVFVAPPGGATLRLPLPDDTIEGVGLSEEGTFEVAGQTLVTDAPLRPGETVVVTRYVVRYDPAADHYRLRITAPLDTAAATVRVPRRFADRIEPLAGAPRAGTGELEGEPLVLLGGEALPAGRSLLVALDGFVPRNDPNPLTEPLGAAAGLVFVAALVGGAAWARHRRHLPTADEEHIPR